MKEKIEMIVKKIKMNKRSFCIIVISMLCIITIALIVGITVYTHNAKQTKTTSEKEIEDNEKETELAENIETDNVQNENEQQEVAVETELQTENVVEENTNSQSNTTSNSSQQVTSNQNQSTTQNNQSENNTQTQVPDNSQNVTQPTTPSEPEPAYGTIAFEDQNLKQQWKWIWVLPMDFWDGTAWARRMYYSKAMVGRDTGELYDVSLSIYPMPTEPGTDGQQIEYPTFWIYLGDGPF